jgi:hypothetical protein
MRKSNAGGIMKPNTKSSGIFIAVFTTILLVTMSVCTAQGKSGKIAIIPICFAKISKPWNNYTGKVAGDFAEYLKKTGAYEVSTQQDIVRAFDKTSLNYMDLTGKTFPEIAEAVKDYDVVIFLGPHPGKDAWFRILVARPSDMMGKRVMFSTGDDGENPPTFDKMGIEPVINDLLSKDKTGQ